MKRAFILGLQALLIGALALAACILIGYYIGLAIVIAWVGLVVVILRGA